MPATMQRPGTKAPRVERPARHASTLRVDIIERDYVRMSYVQYVIQRTRQFLRMLTRPRPRTDLARVVILRDPEVLGGKAVIGGTRVPVWVIDDLYRREGLRRVLEGYTQLSDEEIMGALLYARHSGRRAIDADRQAYLDSIPEHLRD